MNLMQGKIKMLELESQVLGLRTAQIEASDLTPSDIQFMKAKARDLHVKLLLVRIPVDIPSFSEILETLYAEGDFGEGLLDYHFDVQNHASKAPGIRKASGEVHKFNSAITDEMISLALYAGFASCWAMDHNVTAKQVEQLFSLKMREFVMPGASQVVLTIRDKVNPTFDVGFVVLTSQCSELYIELLAVHPDYRRKGIGQALVDAACEWALNNSYSSMKVTISARNFQARRLLESCGGVSSGMAHIFHMYLGSEILNDVTQNAIPNNQPFLVSEGLENLREIFETKAMQTNAKFGPQCERMLEEELGAQKVLLVTSGTAALEMCALLIGSEPGVEVIMPSYTFVSTANAFVMHGATPVFVDIRADTQNIDETKIEAAINSRTRAIVCVHYSGISCEMDTIMTIAEKHNLLVVEDNAHGIFSTYKGRQLGTIGHLGALSFHYTKNIICGEGGAIILNKPELISQALVLWEKGTNRFDFLRGRVSKYAWVSKGSSYVMSELNAAVLNAQLKMRQFLQADRLRIWYSYHEKLEEFERDFRLRRPVVPAGCTSNGHIYYIRVPCKDDFERIGKISKERKISLFTHYEPLHSSAGGIKYGRTHEICAESESCASQLYRLPLWIGLSEEQILQVLAVITEALA